MTTFSMCSVLHCRKIAVISCWCGSQLCKDHTTLKAQCYSKPPVVDRFQTSDGVMLYRQKSIHFNYGAHYWADHADRSKADLTFYESTDGWPTDRFGRRLEGDYK